MSDRDLQAMADAAEAGGPVTVLSDAILDATPEQRRALLERWMAACRREAERAAVMTDLGAGSTRRLEIRYAVLMGPGTPSRRSLSDRDRDALRQLGTQLTDVIPAGQWVAVRMDRREELVPRYRDYGSIQGVREVVLTLSVRMPRMPW